mmetsp:Transcript_2555/g.16727  ORF Transcript_2555/g.16727 Transcript_2555/m.16727 type:complete len:246 (+) Transcript_2555:662-1399(+)
MQAAKRHRAPGNIVQRFHLRNRPTAGQRGVKGALHATLFNSYLPNPLAAANPLPLPVPFLRLTLLGLTRFCPAPSAFIISSSDICPIPSGIPLPPFCIIFVKLCIRDRMALNCCNRLLTSTSDLPLPLATRRLLEGDDARISGLDLSSGVMELIIDSNTFSIPSASLRALSLILPIPGSIFISCPMFPMFATIFDCFKKSLKSNLASMILCCIRSASLASTVSWAFSTNVSTSPIPRMRPTSLSG